MKDMDKHTKIRVESWCKKFCQITNNIEWKKNRNLHAICLLDMIINEHYEEPYAKFAPEGPLPFLPKYLAKSRLTKKFWLFSKKILQRSQLSEGNDNIDDGRLNSAENNNKFEYENGNKNSHLYEIISKCTNPELLNKIIERLMSKINEADEIIIQQNEERNQLFEKIEKLEKIIKPYLKNK